MDCLHILFNSKEKRQEMFIDLEKIVKKTDRILIKPLLMCFFDRDASRAAWKATALFLSAMTSVSVSTSSCHILQVNMITCLGDRIKPA